MSVSYQVQFGPRAQETLKSMETKQSYLIMSWIKKKLVNCEDPKQYGKELDYDSPNEWIYKVGDYRLITNIDAEVITILALQTGHQ